jgi:hypothetical protein
VAGLNGRKVMTYPEKTPQDVINHDDCAVISMDCAEPGRHARLKEGLTFMLILVAVDLPNLSHPVYCQ